MKIWLYFILNFLATLIRLQRKGGLKSIAAENTLLKQQLLLMQRKRRRSPNLSTSQRIFFGFLSGFLSDKRLNLTSIIFKPETPLKFHQALVKRKYSQLFSPKNKGKPGPAGPSKALIKLIIEIKQKNPSYGYRRIAMQISHAFGITIDKDVVRRVLGQHYKPQPGEGGPSWLTFLANAKDSLWSIDLFRCESIRLKSHWVMVVIDQYTRQLVGFAVNLGRPDGPAVCRMFGEITSKQSLPKYLSSDNDPLFKYRQWRANLDILGIEEIKSLPYAPRTHPFIERLILTIRKELLERTFFWNADDLSSKLSAFQAYYNNHRCHWALDGCTPTQHDSQMNTATSIKGNYYWEQHCRGLFQLPVAA